MHVAARLLVGLAGLTAAGGAFAHVGTHVHVHPYLGLEVLVVAVIGGALGVLYARCVKRPPSE